MQEKLKFVRKLIFHRNVESLIAINDTSIFSMKDENGLTPIDYLRYLGMNKILQILRLEMNDHLVFEKPHIFKRVLAKSHKKMQTYQKFRASYFSKELDLNLVPKMNIKVSHSPFGFGLFAEENINKNTFLGEYVGLVRPHKASQDKANAYLVKYPVRHFFSRLVIDASKLGNHTRFINHSRTPNCQMFSVIRNKIPRMIFVSTEKIEKGNEIMVDYGNLYWKQLGKIPL
ncbi:MAG: hypothetical protein COT84_08595 [Chlamydiae bacterium CG10_big_fil_rev_8_21_14_0_10_35_9]|nr:MAG: hypothetical protein COT84_08595 [Chlamydiae bacterium CG10_big_fil_rev_8_21_14_0_10_35_9]